MTMQSIRIHQFGGPQVLQEDSVTVPQPKADEILVRVAAASVNPVDYKIREGKFAAVHDEALPVTLGRDLCGVVAEIGTSISDAARG